MSARNCYPAILAGCLALLATGAAAQTSAGTAPAASPPAATTSAPAKPHHAKAHHATHARHSHKAQTVSQKGTPYQMALRRCVEGQTQQRDSCLDDAISRYSRS